MKVEKPRARAYTLPGNISTLQNAAQQPSPPRTPTPPALRATPPHEPHTTNNIIRLDTTLAELYRANGIEGPFVMTMYCVFGHMDLHPAWPRELIYPEDEEPVPYSAQNEQEIARLRKVILGMKPLRRAFGVGNMDVLFFGPNVTAEGMERALSQLAPNQRHRPVIVDLDGHDVHTQLKRATQGKKLLFWRPQGWMDEHDCLLDPREMFDVNSKKFLITSGMRTPPSEIINLQAVDLTDKSSCVFWTRPLPFVVKLYRAGCSFGTYIVKAEHQRGTMVGAMTKYKSRGTTEVLLSKYIDLVQDLSVHFIVGAPGTVHDRDNPLILGVTVQTLTHDGKWVGGHIDFSMQEELRKHVWNTVRDTTKRMPERFMGWAGVDIVVDREGGQWVVDLNARFTGSMPICFMSGHFWKQRGLPLAEFSAVEYGGDVDCIYTRLESLVKRGQVVVTATARIEEGVNMADVVWGGKTLNELAEVQTWIRQALAKAS
ncbi:solid-state culture specific atp-grasp domain protein [Diaporthe amygdali]|uniref:solid-state culture specific atp-grasp domain protein n=1 Tax=Phomopsis amygdali TaxID=1214568 RepID=UPI0022FEF1D4|nr:solid-state culture specific atp-grasp domain protein [Diaporthe amygdali]KAJ0120982.1 solid-state culture specific atp-grasp domain protein [Diaporthe amygdali]